MADHGDLQIIGNTTPKYSFGINLNLGYKGFEISTLLQGVAKRDFPISGSNYMFGGNNYNFKEHLDYFSTENPNGDVYKRQPVDGLNTNTPCEKREISSLPGVNWQMDATLSSHVER